jgi:hypothetical protein
MRMSVVPEYGEEGEMSTQETSIQVDVDSVPGVESEEEGELAERSRAEREMGYLDAESNEAHAAGKVCERCGTEITASQDARRLVDGNWIHEVCPPNLSGRPFTEG